MQAYHSLALNNLAIKCGNRKKGVWTNPVAGVIVEAPVNGRISIVGRLDGAGFSVTDTDYRSATLLAELRINKRLSVNAG
jgi:hypothetical protein